MYSILNHIIHLPSACLLSVLLCRIRKRKKKEKGQSDRNEYPHFSLVSAFRPLKFEESIVKLMLELTNMHSCLLNRSNYIFRVVFNVGNGFDAVISNTVLISAIPTVLTLSVQKKKLRSGCIHRPKKLFEFCFTPYCIFLLHIEDCTFDWLQWP